MRVELLTYTPEPEKIIATAAKLCYSPSSINDLMEKQTPEKVKSFIDTLMNLGHESPIEHVNFTFAIEGISRITEQQLTRHRIASYSIQSGRYVHRENADFSVPQDIIKNENAFNLFKEVAKTCVNSYEVIMDMLIDDYIEEEIEKDINLKNIINKFKQEPKYANIRPVIILDEEMPNEYERLEKKVKKRALENARYILPQALQTKIIVTMNARSLFNFFKHRCCNRAQEEINTLAWAMLDAVSCVAPNLFKYAGPDCLTKGICPEGSMSCGKPYRK